MSQSLHLKALVLPGHRIEIVDTSLSVGAVVDVTVTPPAVAPAQTALVFLNSIGGRRLFETPEEADRYLQEERDSWER